MAPMCLAHVQPAGVHSLKRLAYCLSSSSLSLSADGFTPWVESWVEQIVMVPTVLPGQARSRMGDC
eukprot:1161329-Pelagomonas_calceolata.AAC.3